ncbi:MAG: T6SS component TssM (IcmF/VasK) [uncultured Paraburkholderia sp.]|nr:MAG: T6SS component TssM (IcmF/VasK) [uncultured Paraburkholderia sp.]
MDARQRDGGGQHAHHQHVASLGGSSDAPQQQSLRGLRLPSSVADVSAAANSVAATNTASSTAGHGRSSNTGGPQ